MHQDLTVTFTDRVTEGLQINRGQPPGSSIKASAAFFILRYDNSHKAGMSRERHRL